MAHPRPSLYNREGPTVRFTPPPEFSGAVEIAGLSGIRGTPLRVRPLIKRLAVIAPTLVALALSSFGGKACAEDSEIPTEVVSTAVGPTMLLLLGSVVTGGILFGLVLVLSRGRLRKLLGKQNEALRTTNSRLVELLGDVEAIIWEATPDAQFTYVNSAAALMLGYPVARWLEPNFFADVLLHPEDRDEAVRVCREATERGENHELEYRVIASSGKVVWLHDVIRVVKDQAGKPILLRGVMLDITKRKLSEDAVHASESRLAAIMAASPAGIFRLDTEGRVTFANQEAARITGIISDSIDLRRWLEAIHPDDRAAAATTWKRIQNENASDHREYRFKKPDGEVVWVLDRGQPERDAAGRVVGFIGTLTDITRIKRNEETIRTHSRVFMSMTEGVNTTDEAGNILYTNAAFDAMFGYDSAELIGKNVSILNHVPSPQFDRRSDAIVSALKNQGSWVGEFRSRRKDGTEFWTRARISRSDGADGTIGVCVQEDITEAKRAQEALRESEEKFRRIAESALVGVSLFDGDRFVFSNDTMFQITGYTPGELAGLDREDLTKMFFGDGPHAPFYAELLRLDSDEDSAKPVVFEDVNIRHKDGGDRCARIMVTRLVPNQSYPRLFVCVETTERKRAELALKESEEKFRCVAESAPVGIALFDGKRYTYANETMQCLIGHSLDEFNSWSPAERLERTYAKEDHARLAAALVTIDSDPKNFKSLQLNDIRVKQKDGSFRWVNALWSHLVPGRGYPMMVMAVDVTERKHAELALHESEEKFRGVAESAYVGIALYDGTRYTYMNQAFSQIVGYRLRDVEGKTRDEIMQLLFDDVDHPRVFAARSALDNAITQHEPVDLEDVRIRHQDGSFRWVSLKFSRLSPDQSMPRMTVCVDMTQRKLAEMALKESEEKFRGVAESAYVGIALYDGTRYTYMNQAFSQIVGYRLRDLEGKTRDEIMQLLFDDVDHPRMLAALSALNNTITQREPVGLDDVRIRHQDGSFRWVSLKFSRLSPDQPMPRMTVCVDMTQRKLAEMALKESEEKFRGVAESSYVGIALYDGARYTYVNQAFSQMIGYSHEDLDGRVRGEIAQLLFDDVDRPRVLAALSELDTSNTQREPAGLEDVRIRHKDGSFRWVSLQFSRVSPDQPMPRMTVCVDMTRRKLAEMALRESEQRLRAIVDSEPECVKLLDETGVLLDMNPAGLAMAEADSIDQVRGLSALDLVAPEYRESYRRGIEEVFAGRSSHTEFEIIGLKGARRWMDQSAVPLRDTNQPGRVKQMLAVTRDVTARKQMEEALRISEALFRAISEQTPDCLLLLDLDDPAVPGRIFYANEAAARMHGLTLDELVGKSISELDDPDTARYVPERIARLRAGETIYFEGNHRRKDGSIFPVDVVALKIPALGGNKVLAIDRDITDRRNAEDERHRIEARMQQTQRLESLGVLAGGIAHDFNNLLAGILGNADLAREDAPAAGPLRESIDQIEVAARRAADLVRQMLAYSGRGNFVVRRVRLGDMVRELAKLLEVTLSKKATLDFDLDGAAPPIAADATQIQQVVMNLITNASDAIGDQPGTITLRSGAVEYAEEALRAYAPHQPPRPGLFVFLEVTDTGCGMDAATLDRMFDPFFSTKFTGRGLGLAATLGIIRGHHGGLRVSSRVGHGTTFRVIFPAAGPESPAADTPAPEATHVPSRAATLLIVDDEPRVRDFLVRALQRSGHEVLVAADGRQALEVYDRHKGRIDAVLLDVTMPEMGGGEVLRALHQRSPGLPVMLMSGFTEAETRGQFGHSSYAGFLQKPFSLDTLRAAIDALLVEK